MLPANVFAQEAKPGEIVSLNHALKTLGKPELLYTTGLDANKGVAYLETFILFEVINVTDNLVKLKALDFSNGNEFYNNKIYSVDRDEFKGSHQIKKPIERISLGIISLPFKIRPQGSVSYSTEFNINGALNYAFYSFWNTSLSLQGGIGIGSVSLDTSNSAGILSGEEQNVSTISLLGGIMLQYKKVQVGVYLGGDHINNQEKYRWNSNGNIWFGLGIGYDLFSVSSKPFKN